MLTLPWANTINLPKTPNKWRLAALLELIQIPKTRTIESRPGEDDETFGNRLKLHVSEKSISVHLRDLSGWSSVSDIQKLHYLTARILWQFRNIQDMKRPEFQAVTMLSEDADDPSRRYLKTFNNWKLYRKDIETRCFS